MVLRTFIKFASVLFLLKFSPAAYAQEDRLQHTIDRLLKHARSSIAKVEEGKIMLHPEKVDFYQGEIYVEGEDGDAIDLPYAEPYLFYNESGPFLLTARKELTVLYICAGCSTTQYRNTVNNPPHKCGVCPSTSFLVRYR